MFSIADSSHVLFFILAVLTSTAMGLVAVWAMRSRLFWFLRASVVGLVLFAGTLIDAYDLILVYFVHFAVVGAGFLTARGIALFGRRSRAGTGPFFGQVARFLDRRAAENMDLSLSAARGFRFSLLDILLGMIFVGTVSAVAASAPGEVWENWGDLSLIGLSLGVTTLAASWLALGQGMFWLRSGVFTISLPAAGIPLKGRALYDPFEGMLFPIETIGWWACLMTFAGGAVLCLWLWLATSGSRRSTVDSSEETSDQGANSTAHVKFRRRLESLGWCLLSVMIFLPPMAAYARLLYRPRIPEQVMPEPNAFDVLVRITNLFKESEYKADTLDMEYDLLEVVDDLDSACVDELRDFLGEFASELAEAHEALRYDFRIPVDYTMDLVYVEDMIALRRISRCFIAEATLAADEGRGDDALKLYQDAFDLGRKVSEGGLLVDYMMGTGYEGWAVNGIKNSLVSLIEMSSSTTKQQFVRVLHSMDLAPDPLEEVMYREHLWQENALGWQARIYGLLESITGNSLHWWSTVEGNRKRNKATIRLLKCAFALAQYRAENGHYPDSLDELVPEYLPGTAIDPFSGKPLVYRVTSDTTFDLYSVGPDGDDDGGRPFRYGDKEGDISLQRRYDNSF